MPFTLLLLAAIIGGTLWASMKRHDPQASRRRWRIVAVWIAAATALWVFIAWSARRGGPMQ